MAGGPFPAANNELNDYFVSAIPYLDTASGRLNIDAGHLSTLDTLYDNSTGVQQEDGWSQLYAVYSVKATVTTTVRNLIKTRKEEIKTLMRIIFGDLPKSQLTAQDRLTLNLPERDTEPTTVQPVNFGPVVSFEKIDNQIHMVRFQNPQTPNSNAMPPGQHVELQMYIGDAGLVEPNIPFTHYEDTGQHILQVDFDPNDKGKTAYYRGRYETDTGKTGPWGDIQNELIV